MPTAGLGDSVPTPAIHHMLPPIHQPIPPPPLSKSQQSNPSYSHQHLATAEPRSNQIPRKKSDLSHSTTLKNTGTPI
uniref:Uncharacterized protein n=1 Tax=Kalanchoe fedtschenkoi TaxID=63787 RepID=A0A7N0VI91_KALFE